MMTSTETHLNEEGASTSTPSQPQLLLSHQPSTTPSPIMPSSPSSGETPSPGSFAQSSLPPSDPPSDFVVPSNATVLRAPSLEDLQREIESIKEQLSTRHSGSQFLLASDIEQSLFRQLEENGEELKGVRATIAHHQRRILYKVIMPGAQHDRITSMFATNLAVRLDRMGLDPDQDHWESRGSARTRGNVCSKEADWSMGPLNPSSTTIPLISWPSLVLEVGVSESLPQLRNDAQWWYANSGPTHSTKLVVLIDVRTRPHYRVNLEVWTEVPSTRGARSAGTRSRPAYILACTQKVRFENDIVHGAPLTLPFRLVMRRAPTGQESDILLDDRTIRRICREVGP